MCKDNVLLVNCKLQIAKTAVFLLFLQKNRDKTGFFHDITYI